MLVEQTHRTNTVRMRSLKLEEVKVQVEKVEEHVATQGIHDDRSTGEKSVQPQVTVTGDMSAGDHS